MSIFTIADLHLSTNEITNKSMEVFGSRWKDYTQKLERNWRAVINPDDTIIIPGDISWACSLEEAFSDFTFLESLPGTKLIGKGNHDFWWSTMSKMTQFFYNNSFNSIKILHNNAYEVEDFIICGTRGWYMDEKLQNTTNDADYKKIISREAGRLELSLEEASRIKKDNPQKDILVFFHFPPVWGNFICDEFIAILKKYSVNRVYFGHIHGTYHLPASQKYKDISFTNIAADFLNFLPMPIFTDY